MTSSHIPDELINNILLRLPVKPLLRFRCVCKPWCSLIDSSTFVKEHLRKNVESYPDSGIIFRDLPKSKIFYLGDVNSLCDSTPVEVANPVKTFLSGAEFVGSCNGLVCLYNSERHGNHEALLWNPATRKCKKLPTPPEHIPQPNILIGSSVIGFGYDHVNDDYKVVRTVDSQIYGIMVSVYSLNSNSWKRAETITNRIRLTGPFGECVNGSSYWLAKNDGYFYSGYSESGFIVAFDLGVEKHRELPFPSEVDEASNNGMGLIVFDRSLCLIDHYTGLRTVIWQMNDNGVGNSWSKLLSLEQPGILGSFKIAYPVAFSKTRAAFLLEVDEKKLMWYDYENNKIKDISVHGVPVPSRLLVYTESLVQLNHEFKLGKKEKKPLKKQQKNDKRYETQSPGCF